MKTKTTLIKRAVLLLLLSTFSYQPSTFAQGTTFTYQGRLNDGANPANGNYDLRFGLYTADVGGNQRGPILTNAATAVNNGLFTVALDFGAVFPGADRWLEIGVRTNGGGTFTTLSPRQPLTPTPYAIFAGGADAAGISGTIPGASIGTGAITPRMLADGAAAANLQSGGQSGVAGGGIVLSENPNNTDLVNAGYVRIGKVALVPENWTNDAPGPPGIGLTPERTDHSAIWTGTEMIVWGGYNGNYRNDGLRYNPATDSWTATSKTGAPSARKGHSAVWTGTQMIVWGGPDNRGGRYNPATDVWTATSRSNAPSARTGHAAVWTGNLMLIWGGGSSSGFPQYGGGGRYNPNTDTWTDMTAAGAPYKRINMAFVWTGSRLIVWGGRTFFTQADCSAVGPPNCQPGINYYWNDGARYNPATDAWAPVSSSGLDWRELAATVWTGTEMLVWGGDEGDQITYNDGARYNLSSDTWSPIKLNGAPAVRTSPSAVWAGNRMVVWGGLGGFFNDIPLDSGGRYDPSTDSWSPVAFSAAPAARFNHTAVWTGSRMIVFGGDGGADYLGDAVRYNPSADTWSATFPALVGSEPSERQSASAVWTGTEMIVWGGEYQGTYLQSGGRFDPILNNWTQTRLPGAPSARINHTAVWTGKEMIIWGGVDQAETATGARLDPVSHVWAPMTITSNTPSARQNHTAVWTGKEMIVWGGVSNIFINGYGDLPNEFASGGRYDPKTDSWTPTGLGPNRPSSRQGHVAVWTGSEMVVWGGYASVFAIPSPTKNFRSDGARYQPASDTWIALPLTDAPTPRRDPAAVWTGSEFIVWGGFDGVNQRTGARFSLANNTWTATDTNTAPVQRNGHAAFWDGSHMIVWGGKNSAGPRSDGGRYDPLTDSWTPMAFSGVVNPVAGNAITWTGAQMITVGGVDSNGTYYNENKAYTPPRTVYLYMRP